MQRVKVTDSPNLKIHCPFCGAVAYTTEVITLCEHTLFVGSDLGFDFVSPKLGFKKSIGLEGKNIDEFTNEIEYPDAIKFCIYLPAPFLCGYVAFAPL